MIAEENKVPTEFVAQMKSMIYNNIMCEFINYSSDEVKNKINIIVSQEMDSIRYALLSEHANVTILREKYKIYENLKKEL